MPTRIRFGWGRFSELRQVVDELGGRRLFLVAARRAPWVAGLLDRAAQALAGLPVEVFAEVEENPSIDTVDRGATRCKEAHADLVIGLGGGSALDACKAIAMLQRNPGSIREYLDGERVCQVKGAPVIAVPTTSGTGSEVTPFSVITHPAKRAKPAIAPPQNFPDVALVDPELTVSTPRPVAASTGLDALCQAVEGFWSTQGNPATRALAFQAILLAIRYLEAACLRKDQESVTQMTLASHLTGIEMSNIGNTCIHPLSYPITVDYGVPHGFACALFLPAVIRFNAPVLEERFRDLLRVLGLPTIEGFADEVEQLMRTLDAPMRLGDLGVTPDKLADIVRRGIGRSTAWNPRPMAERDVLHVCEMVL
jgi:alcohol dehydrogenase